MHQRCKRLRATLHQSRACTKEPSEETRGCYQHTDLQESGMEILDNVLKIIILPE